MVVNHIDKTYVTSDAATILKEVLDSLFSSKSNILLPRCSPWPAKCKRKNVEMPLTLLLPSLDSSSVMLII